MLVAITGGTGFIGRRLVELHLQQGDAVRVLTRGGHKPHAYTSAQTITLNIADRSADLTPLLDGADVVYHCAGVTSAERDMYAVHVDGTRRVLALAVRLGVKRWVQLSSVGVYGTPREGIITEGSALCPVGTYEATKCAADALADEYRDRIEVVLLRPSNVFGPDMRSHSLFELIAKIDRGAFFFIGPVGSSANYIHVDNVTDALYRCGIMSAAKDGIFNLSDWRSIESFVGSIAQALGRRPPLVRLPYRPVRYAAQLLSGFSRTFPLTVARVDALSSRTQYPIAGIKRDLSYSHVVSMEEGIAQMVDAWRSGR